MIEIKTRKDSFENNVDFHITVFDDKEGPKAISEFYKKKGQDIKNENSINVRDQNTFMTSLKVGHNKYAYMVQIKLLTRIVFSRELLDIIARDLQKSKKDTEVKYVQYTTNTIKET